MDILDCLDYVEHRYELKFEQQLILRALTAKIPQNREYLDKWTASVNFDDIDYITLKMVPALYNTFRDSYLDNAYAGRMKGIYRYFLIKNNLIMSDGKVIIKKLVDAGIDVILFKGAAMTLAYYKTPALRHMGDLDVLVRKDQLKHAEEILLANGWKYRYTEEQKMTYVHSYDYINFRNHGFDLHWHSLYETPIDGIDDGIWQRAQSFNWDGISLKIMSSEDLILTSMINGFRNFLFITDPNSSHEINWIYDITQIIKSEEKIAWEIVYEEANNRGLTETLFYAMSVLRELSEKFISTEQINQLFQSNTKFCRDFFRGLISEGRTHCLNFQKRRQVDKFINSTDKWRFLWRKNGVNSKVISSHNKYIKNFLNSAGDVELIYLNNEFIPVLPQVFDITHPARLGKIIQQQHNTQDGYLHLGPGILALKENHKMSDYSAQIDVLTGSIKDKFLPGESITLELKIINTSPHCWVLDKKQQHQIGVSYHLLSSEGQVILWDFPRSYFFVPRRGYVNFIMPGEEIICELPIVMPKHTGRYTIQLDIVQESITWFSEKGSQFPKFEIEVVSEKELVC